MFFPGSSSRFAGLVDRADYPSFGTFFVAGFSFPCFVLILLVLFLFPLFPSCFVLIFCVCNWFFCVCVDFFCCFVVVFVHDGF